MPWKLVIYLVIIVLTVVFIGFNLGNECSLWLIKSFTGVPVFMIVLVSFLAGCIFMLCGVLGKSYRNHRKQRKNREQIPSDVNGISFSKSKKASQEIKDEEIEAFHATPGGADGVTEK